MKTNSTKHWMKVAGLSLAIGTLAFSANAQNTAPTGQATITNAQAIAGAQAGGAVRLIDNKGTIKYLQVENGLTAITNTANGTPTTTWQLGGTLTTNATIVATSGKEFQLNGLTLVTDVTKASSNAVDRANTGTGFTVLIRDEATGSVQKIKLSDLLQVQGGQTVATVSAAQATAQQIDISISSNIPTDNQKVSVYRNGAKLVGGTTGGDYTLASGTVSVKPVSTYGEWALYAGDIIEVQWVK